MIRFSDSQKSETVLALAGVVCSPAHRGNGHGVAVVTDAFSRMDEQGLKLSLFQTEIPEFYEKLGSKRVQNRFVNSKNDDDPEANPWWNDFVMVYRADCDWEEGPVDLLGTGY